MKGILVYYFDRRNLQYDGDCAEGGFGKLSSITDDVYQVFGRRPLFNSFCGEDAEKEEGFAELEGSSWFFTAGLCGHGAEHVDLSDVRKGGASLCGSGFVQQQSDFYCCLGFFMLKEPIRRNQIAALLLEIGGILAIINPFHTSLSPYGVLLAMISTLLFAVYGVMGNGGAPGSAG